MFVFLLVVCLIDHCNGPGSGCGLILLLLPAWHVLSGLSKAQRTQEAMPLLQFLALGFQRV